MAEVTVGIDIGTTSVKAVAADGDGRVAMKAKGRFIPVPRATVDEVQRYLTQPEGTPALEYRNRP